MGLEKRFIPSKYLTMIVPILELVNFHEIFLPEKIIQFIGKITFMIRTISFDCYSILNILNTFLYIIVLAH